MPVVIQRLILDVPKIREIIKNWKANTKEEVEQRHKRYDKTIILDMPS